MNSVAIANDQVSSGGGTALRNKDKLQLRLPATSANLGPGFDALALALTLALEIEATPASEFLIEASGRNSDICSELRRNLMLDVYRRTLETNRVDLVPLSLKVHNEIPIGMGCGSSAAVRLAGVALANHFGGLGWSRDEVLTEASRLEGHPDNAAACWLGGVTIAATAEGQVQALKITPPGTWRVLLVMPDQPLATIQARSVLPASYSREDAVFNIQRACLLTAAFASGRGDLLRTAMQDRLHQPHRGEICPLLPQLIPLAGQNGILGVALSGAGPSVLLLIEGERAMAPARNEVIHTLEGGPSYELIECGIELSAAIVSSAVVQASV